MKPLSLKKWRSSENDLFKTCDCVSLKYSMSLNTAEFSVSDLPLANSLSSLRVVKGSKNFHVGHISINIRHLSARLGKYFIFAQC
jgi:hypothetical protein